MPATKLRTVPFPVTPRKRYRFLIEWAASSTSDALTVYARWLDASRAQISEDTVLSKVAKATHTWQVNSSHLIPPATARYLQIGVAKPNVSTKFAIARVECKVTDTSLERIMREIVLKDDFVANGNGDLPWVRYDISGSLLITKVSLAAAEDSWSEFGVARLTTTGADLEGGTIHLSKIGPGIPPVGTELRTKVRLVDTTNLRVWAGLWSSYKTSPDEALANTISGIGFRVQAAGSGENWFGVCRNGTSETTRDLGVAANTTWRDLGFYVAPTGIQFTVNGVAVGSIVTTNHPTSGTDLAPIYGLVAGEAATKEMDIDIFAIQTTLSR